jgi:hypothetical protein
MLWLGHSTLLVILSSGVLHTHIVLFRIFYCGWQSSGFNPSLICWVLGLTVTGRSRWFSWFLTWIMMWVMIEAPHTLHTLEDQVHIYLMSFSTCYCGYRSYPNQIYAWIHSQSSRRLTMTCIMLYAVCYMKRRVANWKISSSNGGSSSSVVVCSPTTTVGGWNLVLVVVVVVVVAGVGVGVYHSNNSNSSTYDTLKIN